MAATPTNGKLSVNFDQIEALRRSSLLTHADMAKFYGVSRQTYHSWITNKSAPRGKNVVLVRANTKKLVTAVVERRWPTLEAIATPDVGKRIEMLLAVLEGTS